MSVKAVKSIVLETGTGAGTGIGTGTKKRAGKRIYI